MNDLARNPLPLAHTHPVNVVTEALGVDPEFGLASDEVSLRLERDGPNMLPHAPPYKLWRILLEQFSNIVILLLAVAALVAWLTRNELEALAIVVVLVLNGAIGFVLEWQAARAISALRRESRSDARVRRDGSDRIIDAAGLVAGDIIVLSAGDRVPADGRLVDVAGLKSDESALTGESEPVDKSVDPVGLTSLLAERTSMVYLATTVVKGNATAVVTATGQWTELGRIGQMIAKARQDKTPLQVSLDDLGKRLVYIVIGLMGVVFLAGIIRGEELWLMVEVAISLAISAVPEVLPTVTTLILALGVLRMARRRALVRRLVAVESLGSTTVICSDKTGTLTENRMTVREYQLSDGGVIDLATPPPFERSPIFERLLRVSILCSEASFGEDPTKRQAIGDPTETALLIAAAAAGMSVAQQRAGYTRIAEKPFESAAKHMISVFANSAGESLAAMKGGPQVVLENCTEYAAGDGRNLPLDDRTRASFLEANETMAGRGLRVLGFAEKLSPAVADLGNCLDSNDGYVFLGLAGMSDPPRSGVADALQEAHQAGIRVVMLTGDQLSTARSIAGELRLNGRSDISAYNASDILEATGPELFEMASSADVFARVSPEEKLRIVEALKQNGESVAVTGDGINDAPALKAADIGIAMGERGTEVAKEAADIILIDDNFSTIVGAIEGGRTIYANMIKFVQLLFSKNLAQVLMIFSAIVLGLPLPLFPLPILWINLVTDAFPALALALEGPAGGIMRRPPRASHRSLLSVPFLMLITWQATLLAVISLVSYVWALQRYGPGPQARTVAVFALIGVQLGHMFNCRSRSRSVLDDFFGNPFVFAAAAAVVVLQAIAVVFSPLAEVLGVVRPTLADWIVIGLNVVFPVIFVEGVKLFGRLRRMRNKV